MILSVFSCRLLNEAAHRRATIAQMKRYGVILGVISYEYGVDTALLKRWIRAQPGLFIPEIGFDPPDAVTTDFIRAGHNAGRLSAWTQPPEEFQSYLRRLVGDGLGKRIMFGSDQMVWPQAIGMTVDAIESATFLTRDQKRGIYCRNASRFLKLATNPC